MESNSLTAFSELVRVLANQGPTPAESMVAILRQFAGQEVPAQVTKTIPAETCTSTPPVITQEDLIRDTFVLCGLGDSAAIGKLTAAIKLRGCPLYKMSADEFSVVIEFLHPEMTSIPRRKLATILSIVL
uniref:Uncharacterized protein n=1 Tax=viral metagenome TaxID=1070528 RepID=A0A6C0CG46_9ZZZZ